MQVRNERWLRIAVAAVTVGSLVGCRSGGSGGNAPRTSGTSASGTSASASSGARPATIVAVTAAGAVVVLDSRDGHVVRRLVASGAGDRVAPSPDGKTVYYEKAKDECRDEIWRLPIGGGAPALVVRGGSPALSQDGTRLAYVSQSLVRIPNFCKGTVAVAVRDLRTGRTTTYPVAPQLGSELGEQVYADAVSWSPDGARLAVSYRWFETNGGNVRLLNVAKDRYYVLARDSGTLPLAQGVSDINYYPEGVYLPDGRLFVARACCTGEPPEGPLSATLMIVDPANGAVIKKVATVNPKVADAQRNLDADASDRWMLFLSGTDLVVTDGVTTTTLAKGYRAAAW